MKHNIGKVVLFIACVLNFSAYAQRTLVYTNSETDYKMGWDLYNKQKYGAAQKFFQKVISTHALNSETRIEAEYYNAICALELFNPDAETFLSDFILQHPESPKVRIAYFQMGNYQYRKKQFEEAINWYEKVETNLLSREQLNEYNFKLGYSYFTQKNYTKAKPLLYEIKDVDNKFAAPATYYYSHIAYLEKNYATALEGFTRLKESTNFAPIVPFYIVQIYYLQGKYSEVISYAPPLLDSANIKRGPEIAHLIGDSYYRTNNFKEAIPYLEMYKQKSHGITRDDDYQMGYAYYKTGDYKKSIESFKGVVKENDSLSQIALYTMGEAYYKSGKKQFARNSFHSSYKLDFDKEIKEDALFNYAKLSYELDNNPFNQAIQSFETYLNEYPDSHRRDEAFQFLVSVYLSTKNYEAAILSIEKLKKKSLEMEFAYQKICYYEGVELFTNGKFEAANSYFDKALAYPREKTVTALTRYWKAESLYRLGKYDASIRENDSFLYEPGAALTPYFNTVYYNMGYGHFSLKNYTDAATAFRKYTSGFAEKDKKKLNDAFIRIGDCYYITKEYNKAVEFYNEALKINLMNSDYTLFQKAGALGILGNYDNKVTTLRSLLSAYPKSIYVDDAKYELGNSLLIQNQNDKALPYFKDIVDNYPNSSYVKKSLIKMALIYYNSDQNQKALEIDKKIISNYPGSTEANEALNEMKNIYVEQGDMEEFEAFIQSKSLTVSESDLDSSLYEAAELRYLKSDCDNAIKGFTNYLTKFPNGFFALNANYYKADCEYGQKKYDAAITGYSYVLKKDKNKFTEKSVAALCYIYNKKNQCDSALKYYRKMEEISELPGNIRISRIGQMRCLFKLNIPDKTIEAASRVLQTEKVSQEEITEAHSLTAKSALALNNDSLAQKEFETVIKLSKSELSAEAKYNIALLQFKRKKFAEAEKTILEVANQVPSYDYWIAKSYILLSDVNAATGDTYQAEETLKSIIENYEGKDDILSTAKEKLNKLLEQDKVKDQKRQQELMEIKFDVNNLNDAQLFDEDITK
jgi:TolA-binding protein